MPPHLEAQVTIFDKNSEPVSQERKISEPEQRFRDRHRAWSIDQFCQCFGIGRTTVYEQIKQGRLRARKIGKRTIITDHDAEEWLRHLPNVGTRP
jgi:excisionase family DNA binding protein